MYNKSTLTLPSDYLMCTILAVDGIKTNLGVCKAKDCMEKFRRNAMEIINFEKKNFLLYRKMIQIK